MKLHDSGERTEFETGAVRDAQAGKGRMDLLPARALEAILDAPLPISALPSIDTALGEIYNFMKVGIQDYNLEYICILLLGASEHGNGIQLNHCISPLGLIEVSKVFETGAIKYEPRNWEKGIILSRYLDSGLRHIYKYLAGFVDEPHLAMAGWNFLCMLDTILRIRDLDLPSNLNDLPFLELTVTGAFINE